CLLVDSLGSSESGGLGRTLTSADDEGAGATAAFRIGPTTRVVDDDGKDVVPGSGERGRIAVRGHIPIGYYGDPVKTAETFLTRRAVEDRGDVPHHRRRGARRGRGLGRGRRGRLDPAARPGVGVHQHRRGE